MDEIVVKGIHNVAVEIALIGNLRTLVLESPASNWRKDRPTKEIKVHFEPDGVTAYLGGEKVEAPHKTRAVVLTIRSIGEQEWTKTMIWTRDPESGEWDSLDKGDHMYEALVYSAEAGSGFHGLYEAEIIKEALGEPDGLDRLRDEVIEALTGASVSELIRARDALWMSNNRQEEASDAL